MKRIFFLFVCAAVFTVDLFSASRSFDLNNKWNYRVNCYGNNLLHEFAARGQIDAREFSWNGLWKANDNNETPLHVAARFNHSNIVHKFLYEGYVLTLRWALGKEEYSKWLLAENGDGQTALMLARSAKPSKNKAEASYFPTCVEFLELAEKALQRAS